MNEPISPNGQEYGANGAPPLLNGVKLHPVN